MGNETRKGEKKIKHTVTSRFSPRKSYLVLLEHVFAMGIGIIPLSLSGQKPSCYTQALPTLILSCALPISLLFKQVANPEALASAGRGVLVPLHAENL